MKYLVFIVVFCLSLTARAEFEGDSSIARLMGEVESNLKTSDYDAALIPLNQLINLDTILPDKFSFYMGITFYHYKKWGKSRESLLKYVEIAGDEGKFFTPAISLAREAEKKLGIHDSLRCRICEYLGPLDEKEQCVKCDGSGRESFECRNCEGKGAILCYICGGSGVQRSQGAFGDVYATCHMCIGTGKTECFICEGSTLENEICRTCLGEGNSAKPRTCTHELSEGQRILVPGQIIFADE